MTAASARPVAIKITQHVDREERRAAFSQDSLKAWETHRETRSHVSADEADAWMALFEQGNDIGPTECHG